MSRKHLTERFPWLLPLRRTQRQLFFYAAMHFDGNHYCSRRQTEALPYPVFESACPMYNSRTGMDMVYQENKVFNLRLAAKELDGLLLQPGETFSFCRAIRHADRETPYREGLAERNGILTVERGGGLCMLSNLLFWLFLHTPLTVTERHGHAEKAFPEPPSDAPLGVDATVAAGWLDLKLRNDTADTYQICIRFDDTHIHGRIRCNRPPAAEFRIVNGVVRYLREREDGAIMEEAEVLRQTLPPAGGDCAAVAAVKLLYRNRCRIGYALPPGTVVEEN